VVYFQILEIVFSFKLRIICKVALFPALAKAGLRHRENVAKPPLRRRQGGSFYNRLSDVERTAPAAPNSKVALHFFCSPRRPRLSQGGDLLCG